MLFVPAIAFVVTWLLYRLSLTVFPRLNLLDFPERYGLTRARLPYPVGIIAVLSFLCFVPALLVIGQKELGMMAAILLLAFVSCIDDRTPLPSWLRLAVQITVATTLFLSGSRIYTLTNPLGGIMKLDGLIIPTTLFGPLPFWSGVFTIGWLMLTINALNWFDGITGQVSVLSVIGFTMLGCLAYFRNGEHDIAMLSFTLAAIALAGACYDIPPARMLMGDTGSMFFGLLLGLLAVYHGGKVATAFLAFGLPLTDAVLVVLRRIARGHSPLRGGKDHLHHLLMQAGWSQKQIILLTAVLGGAFGGVALFLSTTEKGLAAITLVGVVVILEIYAIRASSSARTPSVR